MFAVWGQNPAPLLFVSTETPAGMDVPSPRARRGEQRNKEEFHMKRWKKGLSLLLAVCLAGSLCACGNDGGNTAPQDPTPPPAEDVPQEDTSQDTYISEDVPQDVDMPEENFPELEPEAEGLIVFEFRSSVGQEEMTCAIHCMDPDTKEESIFSEFTYSLLENSEGYRYAEATDGLLSLFLFQGGRYRFSDDFNKMALDKRFPSSGETHAGWLDDNGNYFDVTEALGLQSKSDFDDPARYFSAGFMNGYFAYYQSTSRDGLGGNDEYYYVPVDNVTPAAVQKGDIPGQNGNPISGEFISGRFEPRDITSWIDDTHYIANEDTGSTTRVVNSFIYDTENQNRTYYVPGNSRMSWNGVVSPDGTQIAFLSTPMSNTTHRPADLYIIPVNGGDPVKVENYPFEFGEYLSGPCQLIDWR